MFCCWFGSAIYLALRQALMARRALIIIDGVDEGGSSNERLERHLVEVGTLIPVPTRVRTCVLTLVPTPVPTLVPTPCPPPR